MITRIIEELGPWLWWALGLILFGIEIIFPGMLMLWIGLAALTVGVVSLIWWSNPIWTWQTQVTLFALLSVLSSLTGRRIMDPRQEGEERLPNRRGQRLVGRISTLSEPIVDGGGRLQMDGVWWIVAGPDLPEGTRIRIIGSVDGRLTVEPV